MAGVRNVPVAAVEVAKRRLIRKLQNSLKKVINIALFQGARIDHESV
jgi:hypothetical protein